MFAHAPHIEEASLLLQRIEREFSPAVLAHSLGAEDVVLAHLIGRFSPTIGIFTLDTGRLNPETYELLQTLNNEGQKIRVLYPVADHVEAWVAEHGINGFYHSLQARRGCCHVRKVEPLARALAGQRAWITGQRRAQSVTRKNLLLEEHDNDHHMAKFNPLAMWSHTQVWDYIKAEKLTHNALHEQGFASIGCAPCTRAITRGEDERAGRWWWEDAANKECGLNQQSQTIIRR